MKNLKNNTAFSLIELSIVILIIGIVIAGVTQSSRMISAFKISTARNLTQSSPVASMKNVTLWWETTSTASFKDSQADNGLNIDTWYDINPTSTTKYNLDQTGTAAAQPYYTTNCINALPCIRFSVSNTADYMTYDGTFLVGSDYTVIVVEQRRVNGSTFYLGGTNTSTTNGNLHLGYRDGTTVGWSQWVNDHSSTVSAYVANTAWVHVFRFSSSTGKTYFLNGVNKTLVDFGGTTTPTQGLVSYAGAALGRAGSSNYEGDLGEIIIFTRAITTEERDAIEVYLGKKWGITVI